MPFHPKKSLGQNFLTNPRVVQKIIETSELTGNELVVEIGPGFGILTEALLENAEKVIAIEKDHELFLSLRRRTSEASALYKNLTLIHADALKVPPPPRAFGAYFLIANIPYSITSPLLDHYIRFAKNLPKRAVLLVQKEVAQKICAKPPRMNVLALHVQTFGDPKIISIVSRKNFKPEPRVDSAILRIDFPKNPKVSCNLEKYFSLIHKGFSHKRKMLRTAFDIACLKIANLDPTSRPESLSIENWISLAKTLPGYS